MWGGVATSCYRCMKSRFWLCGKMGVIVRKDGCDCAKRGVWLCEKRGVIVWKEGRDCVKRWRKLCETLEKVVSYRPLWTRGTVDAHVHIDRYEHVERSIRDDFLVGFARFFRGLHSIFSWVLPDYLNAFTWNIAWFCALWPFIILLCINDKRGVLCAFP